MKNPVIDYLRELSEVRATGAGVAEVSFYPALERLLSNVGKTLKPQVRCVMNLANVGAGLPDGGLFEADQFQRRGREPVRGQKPKRGAIEAKPVKRSIDETIASEQVQRYAREYGLVLVTNFREFAIVERDREQIVARERFVLTPTEKQFWALTESPDVAADSIVERLLDFLRRALLHTAAMDHPRDVAWFLAYYAREALARIEAGSDVRALETIRKALEEALDLTLSGERRQEHFFRSTFVQTLFYGLFSAWMFWSKESHPGDRFDWRVASWYLHVPVIRALFGQISGPGSLEPLGLTEVLDWAAAILARTDASMFVARFEEQHVVQYFYEPFLAAFDPELRKELGVWYTPPEIVEYMVARTDEVLRDDLGVRDGLADPRVVVLDPCCGTGAFLVSVLRRIEKTLRERGEDALTPHDIKKAALERIFGFEILPAPFVVAHLQIGLVLQRLGAPFQEGSRERVGVFLTNALSGWSKDDAKREFLFRELEQERDAAVHVKRDEKILVIIGNPPYNAFAGITPPDQERLVEAYKEGLAAWGIKKYNLDDLYVRFFRIAERRIAEQTGRGIVSFISNYSWVSEPSFVVLRKHLLDNFDRFWIENMHGNRKISEVAPDGRTSETVFAIPGFSPGIQQGVVISLWVKGSSRDSPRVLYRDDLNAARADDRRAQLLATLGQDDFDASYHVVEPKPENRYAFMPVEVTSAYASWPRVVDLAAEKPSNGLMEKRGGALIDIDKEALEQRMRAYFDRNVPWEEVSAVAPTLTKNAADYDARRVRTRALNEEAYSPSQVVRYAARPFDEQWCYYSDIPSLWNRSRPALWRQLWPGNAFLLTRFRCPKPDEGVPFFFTPHLSDDHFLMPDAVAIPLKLRSVGAMLKGESANLAMNVRSYLTAIGVDGEDDLAFFWYHILAVGFAPAYLREHSDAIRQDYPRVPLPRDHVAFDRSVALGRRVAGLLDIDKPVETVTVGKISDDLRAIAVIVRADGRPIDPAAGDLEVTAGWGRPAKGEAISVGRGRSIRYGPNVDVFLNDRTFWSNIPLRVWEYTIGGYTVLRKWLSYRESTFLGRSLSIDEVREFSAIARRLAVLVALEPSLDANYHDIAANAGTIT